MRFGRRSTTSATYAALVAERHLWLVLDGPGTATLRGAAVPVAPDERQGHRGLRLDLTDLTAGSFDVLVDGRPLVGPPVRPSAAGAVTALVRGDAGHLHVVRREGRGSAPVTVRALRLVGQDVEVDLDLPPGSGPARLVDTADRTVATLDLTGDTLVIAPADLADAEPGDHPLRVVVETPAGTQPVRRRDNGLADPGAAALLPAVHPTGAAQALARLRWSPEATLVVRVLGEHTR